MDIFMHKPAKFSLLVFLLLLSCNSGGPLTPADAFNKIKYAVEKNDSDTISDCLTKASLVKIDKLTMLIKDMRSDQLSLLSAKYDYSSEKLQNLKVSDAIALYFFSETTGIKLSRYFQENVVSIDIRGSRAVVKTESGVELDFLREGPYWKFDLSDL